MKKNITKLTKICNTCGNEFYVLDNYANRIKKYCSPECKSAMCSKRASEASYHAIHNCDNCGQSFNARSLTHRFCSTSCRTVNEKRGYFVIYERDNFRCIYCGKSSVSDNVSLHIDHIIPVDSGGKDTASNLVTACSECNLYKSSNRLRLESVDIIYGEIKARNKAFNIHDEQLIKLFTTAEKRASRNYK